METEVTIKTAGAGDVGILSGLVRDSYRNVAVRFGLTPDNCPKHPSNCTDDWIQSDFKRGVSFYLLEHNGRPIGCAALEVPEPGLGYLERLAVLPANRKNGFGRLLVDHVLEQAANSAVKKISIGIIAGQTELKRWYQKIGFVETDTRQFEHLPFSVTFMLYHLPAKGGIDEN